MLSISKIKLNNPLPTDCWHNVVNFINISNWQNIVFIDKQIYNDFSKKYKSYIENDLKFVKKINKNVIELFGGYKKFITYPLLNFKNYYIGCTDYIDRVKHNDMISPIMIGIDYFKRPFISIRYLEDNKKKVVTVFQRYTEDNNLWSHGTAYMGNSIISFSSFFNGNDFKDDSYINIKRLLKNDPNIIFNGYDGEFTKNIVLV